MKKRHNVRLVRVNEYLAKKIPGVELVKGKGYFYFSWKTGFAIREPWPKLPGPVYVYAITHLSWEKWKGVIDSAAAEFHRNR